MGSRHPPTDSGRQHLATVGTALVAGGVSLATLWAGAQSAPYYLCIVAGTLLTVPNALQHAGGNQRFFRNAILLSFAPLLLYCIQLAILDPSRFVRPSLLQSGAISTVLLFASLSAFLSNRSFRRAMTIVAVVHIALCTVAAFRWSQQLAGAGRLEVLDIRTAVWAELALGAIVAATLSANRYLVVFAWIVGGLVIYGTQMRGVGVTAVAAGLVYLVLRISPQHRTKVIVAIGTAALIGVVVYREDLWRTVSTALLLDDRYRGLGTGFSGRFENWSQGLERSLQSPVIGVGVGDPTLGYTHNGYLKAAGELGIAIALCLLWCLVQAFRQARAMRSPSMTFAILALGLSILTAPRYINFQVMPLLGLVAAARVLLIRSQSLPRRAAPGAKNWSALVHRTQRAGPF